MATVRTVNKLTGLVLHAFLTMLSNILDSHVWITYGVNEEDDA